MVAEVARKPIDQADDAAFSHSLRAWHCTGGKDDPADLVSVIRARCDVATNIYLTEMDDAGFWAYRMSIVSQSFSLGHKTSFVFSDYPDRPYFESVVQPCFRDFEMSASPVLHRIRANIQGKLAVYERLTLPLAGRRGMRQSLTISKLLGLVEHPDPIEFDRLSLRERQCLSLLSNGLSAKRISAKLDLSQSTVENHIDHLKGKLAVRSVAQAAAVAALYGGDLAPSPKVPHASLSGRERQCLGYLASGLTVKEIAELLDLSARTVELQVGAMKRKLRARNIAEAVAMGMILSFGRLDRTREN